MSQLLSPALTPSTTTAYQRRDKAQAILDDMSSFGFSGDLIESLKHEIEDIDQEIAELEAEHEAAEPVPHPWAIHPYLGDKTPSTCWEGEEREFTSLYSYLTHNGRLVGRVEGWDFKNPSGTEKIAVDEVESYKRRIIACMNAFEGMPVETIENMQIRELVLEAVPA